MVELAIGMEGSLEKRPKKRVVRLMRRLRESHLSGVAGGGGRVPGAGRRWSRRGCWLPVRQPTNRLSGYGLRQARA